MGLDPESEALPGSESGFHFIQKRSMTTMAASAPT
jgi:hypothetical protein